MSSGAEDPEVRMEIRGLIVDPRSNHVIVILYERDRDLFLPIWIGPLEASAIRLRLEKVRTERPMTHDLTVAMLQELGAETLKVVVNDLQDNTYFATIVLRSADGRLLKIDSRPSDAIALAVRVSCPIYACESVLEGGGVEFAIGGTDDEEKLKKWFESLNPDDLGKYEM